MTQIIDTPAVAAEKIEALKHQARQQCRCFTNHKCSQEKCARKDRSAAIEELKSMGITLDSAVTDVAAMMARMKLTGELGSLRKQIAALGTGAGDMLARIKLVSRSNQIRKELGVGIKTAENPHVATLKAVAAGQHDTKGLPELFGLIQEAVNGLDEAGLLTGDAYEVANDAITHWAELEERLSANV